MIFVQVILTFAKRVRTKTIVLILEALLSIFNFSRDQFVFSGEYKSINYPLVFPTGIDHDRHHKWPLISYKPESKIIIRSWSIQSPESLKIPKIYFTKILLKNTANRCMYSWLLINLKQVLQYLLNFYHFLTKQDVNFIFICFIGKHYFYIKIISYIYWHGIFLLVWNPHSLYLSAFWIHPVTRVKIVWVLKPEIHLR